VLVDVGIDVCMLRFIFVYSPVVGHVMVLKPSPAQLSAHVAGCGRVCGEMVVIGRMPDKAVTLGLRRAWGGLVCLWGWMDGFP